MLEIVRVQIQQHLTAVAELEERVLQEYAAVYAQKRTGIDRKIQQVRQARSRSKIFLDGLYQNLNDGLIARDEYASMKSHYREQCAEYDREISELEAEYRSLERYGPQNPMFAVCRRYKSTELSEELIHDLIASIKVYDDSRLEIRLVYQDEFLELSCFWEGGGALCRLLCTCACPLRTTTVYQNRRAYPISGTSCFNSFVTRPISALRM